MYTNAALDPSIAQGQLNEPWQNIDRVKSDAPRQKLEALCEYTQKTSPVLDTIRNPVPVSITLAD